MNQLIDTLLTDLRTLIADLGKDGGLMSPSVYDTAQVLRFCPPKEGVKPALEWILGQQQPDGGWGNPAVPLSRTVPTLSAVLALYTYKDSYQTDKAIHAGLTFLQQESYHWREFSPGELPVGVELVLPKLIEDAAAIGLNLDKKPYAALVSLGRQKREYITQKQPSGGSAPSHSWETWGTEPNLEIIDGSGGVGHSPAATAAWLQSTIGNTKLIKVRQAAQQYLTQSTKATGVDIPGVVPTVWPINRFEQSWGLYALFVSGLLNHPKLVEVLRPSTLNLANALKPNGIGMSDYFTVDGDITATTTAILNAADHPTDITRLRLFQKNNGFFTYPGELQPSLTTTAHIVLAFNLAGQEESELQHFLIKQQDQDGKWSGDKWHSSWLYTTCAVVNALAGSEQIYALESAAEALVTHQKADGGWSISNKSRIEETAYGIITLLNLQTSQVLNQKAKNALHRASRWMLHNHSHNKTNDHFWIGKELYSPYRVERVFELSALLAIALEEVLLS